MTERASIFDNGVDFDVSGFTPKTSKSIEKTIPVDALKTVSEAAQFPSREAAPESKKKQQEKPVPEKNEIRRYRTGRNVQLNIKVKAETLKDFYDLADKEGLVLGEVLEKAIEALKERLAAEK